MKSGDWLSISHCSRTRTRSPLLEPRSLTASSGLQTSIAAAMVLTNFNGAGVGFGFGAGCGFGVGWGFGGGDCGVGLGLGWGFGTALGSQYHSSGVTFQGIDFGKKEHDDAAR